MNHKRVVRMMREDNQLAVQPKQFVVTTNSSYTWEVYLNLAHCIKVTGIQPTLGGGYHLYSAECRIYLFCCDP